MIVAAATAARDKRTDMNAFIDFIASERMRFSFSRSVKSAFPTTLRADSNICIMFRNRSKHESFAKLTANIKQAIK
jgi:hypothetical protein